MTDFPYISGVDVGTICNKEFARFETTKASEDWNGKDKGAKEWVNVDFPLTSTEPN